MSNRKVFKLSLITAACIAVSAPVFAGQIIGVQQGTPSPEFTGEEEYKNGFGGWNLGNVDVRIIDVETGLETKSFDPDFGSYTPMVVGESFKSDIYDRSVVDSTVGAVRVGILGGKDWPKGEPSGVKVITTDAIENQSNGRPNSCIMSTSYHPFSDEEEWVPDFDVAVDVAADATLEDGVLGSGYINPTLCDSPFQTHKRFKVSALPGSIIDTDTGTTDIENNGMDIVFNLDTVSTETEIRRYTVLQKLNNYTDSRLTGFRIELGFGVGDAFTRIDTADTDVTTEIIDHLRLSLGTGETTITDPETGKDKTITDFWKPEDWAKFSAGLFSLADAPHHPNNGFFSAAPEGVGYDVALRDAGTIESNSTIGLSPEYKKLFGEWIPSKMVPKGIFYDDDMDPATDNELVAFWGLDTDGKYKWLSGNENDFLPITNDQLYSWANNTGMPDGSSQYGMDAIEDLLNLGLNYMVEVGNVQTIIDNQKVANLPVDSQGTFTIRMIPVTETDVDNSDPGWITDSAGDDIATAIPADYEPADETLTTSSGGSSASALGNTGAIAAILAFLGLGGWLARRKLAK